MKSVSVREVEEISFYTAKKLTERYEPIPEFKTRSPGILESCLIVPFQEFDRKSIYKGLVEKGAILFYLMIKNHPFQNGNKRIAVMTFLFFLWKNKKWLRVDNKEFYNFAVWVAESPAKSKKGVLISIQEFIRLYLVDLQ
jgi:death-on-curing protein